MESVPCYAEECCGQRAQGIGFEKVLWLAHWTTKSLGSWVGYTKKLRVSMISGHVHYPTL